MALWVIRHKYDDGARSDYWTRDNCPDLFSPSWGQLSWSLVSPGRGRPPSPAPDISGLWCRLNAESRERGEDASEVCVSCCVFLSPRVEYMKCWADTEGAKSLRWWGVIISVFIQHWVQTLACTGQVDGGANLCQIDTKLNTFHPSVFSPLSWDIVQAPPDRPDYWLIDNRSTMRVLWKVQLSPGFPNTHSHWVRAFLVMWSQLENN